MKFQASDAFNTWGFEYGPRFASRLSGLRQQIATNKTRSDEDLEYFNSFRTLHPRPTHNHRQEPLWDGSEAQMLLNLDMDNNKHKVPGFKPVDLYNSRNEYKQWTLEVFRWHIHQESDTRKYLHTLKKNAEVIAIKKSNKVAKTQQAAEDYAAYHEALEEAQP